jgi:preprotein translocase subunit SecA
VSQAAVVPVDQPLCPPNLPSSGRLGWHLKNCIQAVIGRPAGRKLARAATYIPGIRKREQALGNLSDAELVSKANTLRGRAKTGDKSTEFITEGFALCSVSIWRTLGMRAFDVQLAAGLVMYQDGLVELATGEGKTLTATFPAFLHALAGKGIHVTTVNDYLAKRDAELMGPVFQKLGLTVGVIHMGMEDPPRAEAYRRDITYGTASEFGFDFLRDRLKSRGGQVSQVPFWSGWMNGSGPPRTDKRVQRGHYCAIVDEADSIFIDEARTPLIISTPSRLATPEEAVIYTWANDVVQRLKPGEDFLFDNKKDKIELTEAGRHVARYSNPPTGEHTQAMDKLFEALEKAAQAHYRLVRDHQYMVIEDKVVIVDESTGRPMPDRHWRDGLHQAVEAKEKQPIHLASDHAAQVTFQSYYRLYHHLCGMSGTLVSNDRELRRVYRRRVICVPTNRPVIRQRWPDRVFLTKSAKYDAIVEQVAELQAKGRPILIGTRSVEKSEAISLRLTGAGIVHQVLNAKQNEQEASIVAQAGRPGRVTVATNMAGRGTDIILGGNISKEVQAIREDKTLSPEEIAKRIAALQAEWRKLHEQVIAAGGLHVIATERHEAVRVDRQLLGRAGRQGDPGSGQIFLCMEDQLLEAFGREQLEDLAAMIKRSTKKDWNAYRSWFRRAQRITERRHYRQRLDMLHHDKRRREMLSELGADPFVD